MSLLFLLSLFVQSLYCPSVVAFGGKLVQFLSFLLVVNWYNHSISQHTTFSIDETLKELFDPDIVKCCTNIGKRIPKQQAIRVQSCLFVLSLLFLLSLFVQSLYCHIFGPMMFWIIRLVASVFIID
jgi:hypothetical protein